VVTIADTTRWHRLLEIALWIIGIAVVVELLQLAGFDITGWFSSLWKQVTSVPAKYLVAGVILQTGQTVLTGASYYGILAAAYPGEVTLMPIIAAYAVGVAGNGFLPANIGTFVTLIMFIAIIPGCTFAGSIAAYLVQKIFFTIVGTFVYLYLFLSVPGTFDVSFGKEHDHPALVVIIVAGALVLTVMLVRIFWRQVKKLWAQAKKGGAILATPGKYMSRVFLPSFLGYLCKIGVIAVFLAAFAIPVTFNSIMWVIGSGSLANVASFTPGAVGITQATNALALKTCCNVPNETAVAYSTAQQLVTTAWNVIFALIAVVYVFGWTGGRQLVSESYAGAKEKTTEMREERKRKKEEKKDEKKALES
jgi:glycosyltransferase 2 family protein